MLENTTLTAEKEYDVNFTKQNEKFYLSLYYNGVNNHIFVQGVEIYKFKAEDFEIMQLHYVYAMFQKTF